MSLVNPFLLYSGESGHGWGGLGLVLEGESARWS
jgi:hypothetical protein